MSSYQILFTKEAKKDFEQLTPKLKSKLKELLINKVAIKPYDGKKLQGDLAGFYSLRLTYQDRIVYDVDEENHRIHIHRVKTHDGE